MIIALVRHGETNFNKAHILQGQLDTSLNDTGIQQAWICGELLKSTNINWSTIYSNSLKRAAQTAQIFSQILNKKIKFDDNLKERDYGEATGLSYEKYKKLLNDKKDIGIEKNHNFELRVISAFHKIIEFERPNNFILVSHGGCISRIISNVVSMKIYIENASPIFLEYTQDTFRVANITIK